jgi:hypothetical protein
MYFVYGTDDRNCHLLRLLNRILSTYIDPLLFLLSTAVQISSTFTSTNDVLATAWITTLMLSLAVIAVGHLYFVVLYLFCCSDRDFTEGRIVLGRISGVLQLVAISFYYAAMAPGSDFSASSL